MQLNPYLVLAYIVLWGLLALYLGCLGIAQRRLRRRLEALESKSQS